MSSLFFSCLVSSSLFLSSLFFSCLVLSLFLCLSLSLSLSVSLCLSLSLSVSVCLCLCVSLSVSVWCCVLWCCVVCVVRTWCNDDVSVDTVTRACTEFGWQNAWEQALGVPATPEPAMTKNSSSSRAHLALNVRMDGARKRPVKRAKKPFPHRHRHNLRNCPIFSTTCCCGNSAVFATTCDCGACTTNTTGTSTTFQKYCNCEISMDRNLHSFLHCLDHRHLSLTTAGMSTTLSKNTRDETIFSTSCNCGSRLSSPQLAPEKPVRPAQQGHRPPCQWNATAKSRWSADRRNHGDLPLRHDRDVDLVDKLQLHAPDVACGVCGVPVCTFKNASVCTFKTSPCVPAPRPHVLPHAGVVPVHTGTF